MIQADTGTGGMQTPSAAIDIKNLTVDYHRHPALHHINCQIRQGSMTAIVGPNGAGKSTLLKSLMKLTRIESGEIRLNMPHAQIAYLPQRAELDTGFPISVFDCVLLGYWATHHMFRRIDAPLREKVFAALSAVGLEGFARRAVGSLSIGQFQRVLFARILVQEARMIFLDEPFNAVDEKTQADLLRLIHQWHASGCTIVAVLHDLAQVHQHFPETVLLARKLIAHGPTDQALSHDNLVQARAMPEAWNDFAEACAPLP